MKKNLLVLTLFMLGIFIPQKIYAYVYFLNSERNIKFTAPVTFSCQAGYVVKNGICVLPCDTEAFPYTEEPDEAKGVIEICEDVDSNYWRYKSCNEGWTLTDGQCLDTQCSELDYPYSTDPGNYAGTVITCKSGADTYRYGYSSCNEGWTQVGNACNENDCSDYKGISSTIANCATVEACRTGLLTKYTCANCVTGYHLDTDNASCILDCPFEGYPLAVCPLHANCAYATCGGATKYRIDSCKTGYKLDGNACIDPCLNNAVCDGKNNTTMIVNQYGADAMAAYAATRFYAPGVSKTDPNFGQGKWYLPAMLELMETYGFDFSQITSSNL